jgi:CBS domain containing-hemolysin-like protein
MAASPNGDAPEAGASRTDLGSSPKRKRASTAMSRRRFALTLALIALAIYLGTLNAWLLSVVLLIGCGLNVSFEFALVKTSVHKLELDVQSGVPGSEVVLGMKREMNAILAACQLGITLTSLGLTLALEPAIHHALADYEQVRAYSVALAMALGTLLHVTFGELIPKGLALVVPVDVLYLVAPFMRLFRVLAVPFIKTCNAVANVVVQGLTGRHPDTAGHHEESVDIGQALVYAYAEGAIKPQQLRLMRNVLTFTDRTVREAMTPAREVVTLDLQSTWQENMAVANEHGFSRLPVINGGPHDVVGYVRRADLLQAELAGRRDLKALVRPIERRPETAALNTLNLFRGSPMIAVFDEHDSFTGLLTAEDIVEQIVGEIYDETDDAPPRPEVETLADGSIRVAGEMLLEPAAEALALASIADHQDVDTVGGLVLKQLGRLPRTGDTVTIERYRVVVLAAKGFRITQLHFQPLPDEEEADEEAPRSSSQLTPLLPVLDVSDEPASLAAPPHAAQIAQDEA